MPGSPQLSTTTSPPLLSDPIPTARYCSSTFMGLVASIFRTSRSHVPILCLQSRVTPLRRLARLSYHSADGDEIRWPAPFAGTRKKMRLCGTPITSVLSKPCAGHSTNLKVTMRRIMKPIERVVHVLYTLSNSLLCSRPRETEFTAGYK